VAMTAEAETRDANRVIAFGDAVVAIAITLLALDLPVPSGLTNGQFLAGLGRDWSSYVAFLISFLVIANHWAGQRRTFRYVSRLNERVFQLYLTWLLMIILVPFATRVVTGNGDLGARFTLYALIQVIATACSMLISREVHVGHLLDRDAPDQARHADLVPYASIIITYLISIPVAFSFGAWSFVLWALSPRIGNLLRRSRMSGRLAADDESRPTA
jgi:uncharacterized membrane protein